MNNVQLIINYGAKEALAGYKTLAKWQEMK